jgi:hypothetical protein
MLLRFRAADALVVLSADTDIVVDRLELCCHILFVLALPNLQANTCGRCTFFSNLCWMPCAFSSKAWIGSVVHPAIALLMAASRYLDACRKVADLVVA